MRKKVLNVLSFITIIFLFGITLFCIFDGNTSVKADQKNDIVKTKVKEEPVENKTVYVDIKGAVNNPGVYEVDSNSRIIDVIKLAGDLKDDADTSALNLSKKVEDEMYIIIYTKEEMLAYKEKMVSKDTITKEIENKIECPDNYNDACLYNISSENEKVNINTATKDELSTLQGIGESKANNIIEYRNNTKFTSIDDIKNVNGIGDSIFEKIKDNIEV